MRANKTWMVVSLIILATCMLGGPAPAYWDARCETDPCWCITGGGVGDLVNVSCCPDSGCGGSGGQSGCRSCGSAGGGRGASAFQIDLSQLTFTPNYNVPCIPGFSTTDYYSGSGGAQIRDLGSGAIRFFMSSGWCHWCYNWQPGTGSTGNWQPTFNSLNAPTIAGGNSSSNTNQSMTATFSGGTVMEFGEGASKPLTRLKDSTGRSVDYTYESPDNDSHRRPTVTTLPDGRTYSYSYTDEWDRHVYLPDQITHPDGQVRTKVQYGTSSIGRPVTATNMAKIATADPSSQASAYTTFVKDSSIEAVTVAAGSTDSTGNETGDRIATRLTNFTDANGRTFYYLRVMDDPRYYKTDNSDPTDTREYISDPKWTVPHRMDTQLVV